MNVITSVSNAKIKQVIKLASSKTKRYESKLAVIYGLHLVLEAVKHGLIYSLFIQQNKADSYLATIQAVSMENVYLLTDEVLAKINLADTVTDIIGLIHIKTTSINNNTYIADCVILDNIQDPGNLGTIMRSCMACGVENILLSKSSVDPYNLKVIRASQGLQFGLNIILAVDIIKFINNYKYTVIATLPSATINIYSQNLSKPCAWLFGNEGSGISANILDSVDCKLAIPMQKSSESLNVAMATTLCLFEMQRQRLYANL